MRQTYDILSCLGDIGGLTDCLLLASQLFLYPFTSYSLQTFLLSRLFRMQPLKTHVDYQINMSNLKKSSAKGAETMNQRKEIFIGQFASGHSSDLLNVKKLVDHIKRNFQQMLSFGRKKFCMHMLLSIFGCCEKNQSGKLSHRRYNWFLNKSKSIITKELDLKKFLTR